MAKQTVGIRLDPATELELRRYAESKRLRKGQAAERLLMEGLRVKEEKGASLEQGSEPARPNITADEIAQLRQDVFSVGKEIHKLRSLLVQMVALILVDTTQNVNRNLSGADENPITVEHAISRIKTICERGLQDDGP